MAKNQKQTKKPVKRVKKKTKTNVSVSCHSDNFWEEEAPQAAAEALGAQSA